jgi:hypothetical protein
VSLGTLLGTTKKVRFIIIQYYSPRVSANRLPLEEFNLNLMGQEKTEEGVMEKILST